MSLLAKGTGEPIGKYVETPDAGELFMANYRLATGGQTTTTALFERGAMTDAANVAGAKVLSADEINKMFPGVNATGDMNSGVAAFIHTDIEDKRADTEKVNNRNASFLGKLAGLAGSLVAHATDPIDATVGIATAGLGRMALAGKALSTAGKFGVATAENVFQNTISETLVYANTKDKQQEYTAAQFAVNVIAASTVFAAASTGVGVLAKRFGRSTTDIVAGQVDTALEGGKHPSSVVDSTMANMEREMVDGKFNGAFKESFPELATDNMTLREGFDALQTKVAAGEISEEALNAFNAKLDEVGFDRAKADYADPNSIPKFSDEVVSEQNKILTGRESDIGFSSEARNEFANIEPPQKDYIPDTVESERMKTILAERGDNATLESIAEMENIEVKKLSAIESFFNCIIGG